MVGDWRDSGSVGQEEVDCVLRSQALVVLLWNMAVPGGVAGLCRCRQAGLLGGSSLATDLRCALGYPAERSAAIHNRLIRNALRDK